MVRLNIRKSPPRATAMLESLRGLGYSTSSALADIIDNSISAGATEVRVFFYWKDERSLISIVDDGIGMTDAELESALRLGDRNPLEERGTSDLGRFGMGLKTASFSQCRRLTVASKRIHGSVSCLRWDLDEIAANPDDGWFLIEGAAAEESTAALSSLDKFRSGTVVLWEQLDRIVTSGYSSEHFVRLIDDVERRLSMVFHRFIESSGRSKLRLYINDRVVNPWDPFMVGHPSKPWNSPIVRRVTPSGSVEVECHVLPHRDRLSEREFELASGPEGWALQQGFYVYRNNRLLLAGGWLGLGNGGRTWHREESYRLARIRLDIPNSADAEWKIDIRKSTARIPVSLKPWLTNLGSDTRDKARRVFAWRGSPVNSTSVTPLEQAWKMERTRAGVRYRIDTSHPVVSNVLESVGSLNPTVKAMLRVIEETVPVQRIWLDTAENNDVPKTGFEGEPAENIREVLSVVYNSMLARGIEPVAARRVLLSTEPFQNFPNLISSL